MTVAAKTAADQFLSKTGEKADFNQYWYSSNTIAALVAEVQAQSTRAAFLSTPSLYFSLPDGDVKKNSFVFDLDEQWAKNPNFAVYDFTKPEAIDPKFHGYFDCVVIDPPFITPECWRNYAVSARLLLAPGGKVIASTIAENAPLMKELLGATPQRFQPSIPHLVYQYNMYVNYDSVLLASPNPEIPE